MGYFFLDDSKHEQAGFCLSSFVFSQANPQEEIEEILLSQGLLPGRDEFKSSARMREASANTRVREYLQTALRSCKIGVAVSPKERRLHVDSAILLRKMLTHPDVGSINHTVFVDREIARTREEQDSFVRTSRAEDSSFYFEQDSKIVGGIQLADLAAHTCAMMMKDALGLVTKTVKAGVNSGYDPDDDLELGFVMFASIRYSFLGVCAPYVWEEPKPLLQPLLITSDYGLQISGDLPAAQREAAESKFASIYLGCMH